METAFLGTVYYSNFHNEAAPIKLCLADLEIRRRSNDFNGEGIELCWVILYLISIEHLCCLLPVLKYITNFPQIKELEILDLIFTLNVSRSCILSFHS